METRIINKYKIDFYSFDEYSKDVINNTKNSNIRTSIFIGMVDNVPKELTEIIVEKLEVFDSVYE